MTTTKNLGIWMDHSNAHLMEFMEGNVEETSIESKITHNGKDNSLQRSEHTMHNKEQHLQADYYKQLGEVIRNYDAVLLFGPTDAKAELFNLLRADQRFARIKITILQSDKMTESQEYAFVKAHFSRN